MVHSFPIMSIHKHEITTYCIILLFIFVQAPPTTMQVVLSSVLTTTRTISCTSNGEPPPTIHFQRHHAQMSPQAYLATPNQLHIPDFQLQDFGVYSCEASNTAGTLVGLPFPVSFPGISQLRELQYSELLELYYVVCYTYEFIFAMVLV